MEASRHEQPKSIVVCVPITLRRYGGRKQIVLPDDAGAWASQPEVDKTLVKALARAFRWRKLLETGAHSTVKDIARAERISASYVSRILRLTLLAPGLVEAILDGTQGPEVTLARVLEPFPEEWRVQGKFFR